MKQWLAALSAREKLLLSAGGAVLMLVGLYAFIYSPLQQDNNRLQRAILDQQQLTQLLQTIRAEAIALRQIAVPDNGDPVSSESLMSVLDSSSLQMGIKPAIKKLAPESQKGVGLWIENCAFDKLTLWLTALDNNHGIKVKQIDISREEKGAGLVRGKIVLSK